MNLVFPVIHLDQMLESRESVVHQLIVKEINQISQKQYCLLASVLTSSGA
jgi:hypothetical protein